MPKKRIRLEFTAIGEGDSVEWLLDKKLFALRLMLKSQFGAEAVHLFNGWLAETSENPNYLVGTKPKKRASGKVR